MLFYRTLMKLLLLSVAISSFAYGESVTPLQHFAEYNTWSDIKVSPSGHYLAGIVDNESGLGGSKLVVIDTESKKYLHEVKMTGRAFVDSYIWANNERLIAWEGNKSGISESTFPTGNIIAVNVDGRKKRWIYGSGKQSKSHVNRFSGRSGAYVEHRLPDDDKHVLMQVYSAGRDGAHTRLVKLNIYTGREQTLGTSPIKNANLVVDGDGELRYAFGTDIDDSQDWKLFERSADDWKLIRQTEEYGGTLVPQGFTPDNKSMYVLDNISTDRQALYLFDTQTGGQELIYEHPVVDISRVMLDTLKGEENAGVVAGVWVMPDYPQYVPLSEESEVNSWYFGLQKQFPDYTVTVTSQTTDKDSDLDLAVIRVRSDTHPGMFLLYDIANKKLSKIEQAHAYIDPSKMRAMEPYRLTMRDGKTVYAYLTRPDDGDGPFPMVVHPHGGPFGVRDGWRYDRQVQMLASRGYAVLQVNFRGSGGYGKDFMHSAFRQWGEEMQDDLTDATRWAIDEGITEAGKVCLYGASYGGYSALMSAVKEPDLYACTAGYVGVYDLELMLKKGDIQRRDYGVKYIREAICKDDAQCRKQSPITYIDALKADVMIIHGALDQRVPIAHAEVLMAELDRLGKPYESMIKSKEGHGFRGVDNNVELFERLLAFLSKNIGSESI
jgi:dipeptidyl aminopeptidase/acylaminoacyl peptidase